MIKKIIVIVIVSYILIFAVGRAESKSEIANCMKLLNQSKAGFDGKFFITSWQDEMCKSHGIIISADVINTK